MVEDGGNQDKPECKAVGLTAGWRSLSLATNVKMHHCMVKAGKSLTTWLLLTEKKKVKFVKDNCDTFGHFQTC